MSDNITNNVVFVGNPGTGKSTLLNGLIGKVEFESGVSFGEGLTQRLQRYTHTDGTVYMDTPGLDDIKSKKEAAAEIEAALRSGGSFRIFFLVLLDSGRARASDIATMRAIVNAIKVPFSYGVIVNKLSPQLREKMTPDKMDTLEACFTLVDRPLADWYAYGENSQLRDTDNALVELEDGFADWVAAFPATSLDPENVDEIDTTTIAELREEALQTRKKYEADLEQVRTDLANAQRARRGRGGGCNLL